MERRAEEILAQGPLEGVKMLREFEPAERVAARLEVSTGGMLSGTAAGVDVMGDGSVVAFGGGVRRRPLEPRGGQTPFDAVRAELSG
jgi:ribulose 1,5-bisphosphate carboxylase large subunit-like protein